MLIAKNKIWYDGMADTHKRKANRKKKPSAASRDLWVNYLKKKYQKKKNCNTSLCDGKKKSIVLLLCNGGKPNLINKLMSKEKKGGRGSDHIAVGKSARAKKKCMYGCASAVCCVRKRFGMAGLKKNNNGFLYLGR